MDEQYIFPKDEGIEEVKGQGTKDTKLLNAICVWWNDWYNHASST